MKNAPETYPLSVRHVNFKAHSMKSSNGLKYMFMLIIFPQELNYFQNYPNSSTSAEPRKNGRKVSRLNQDLFSLRFMKGITITTGFFGVPQDSSLVTFRITWLSL